MSNTTHRTANGKNVSIENIRLENEHVIAIGNMKVNARGDALGPGGVPGASRQQAVNEYYNLHTPTVGAVPVQPRQRKTAEPVLREQQFDTPVADPLIEEQDQITELPVEEPVAPATKTRQVRGSLATTLTKK